MTTTSSDNDHVDQEDIKMEEDDLTPHQSHPGIENPEEIPYFIDSEVFPNFAQSVSFDRTYSKHLGPIEGNTLYILEVSKLCRSGLRLFWGAFCLFS